MSRCDANQRSRHIKTFIIVVIIYLFMLSSSTSRAQRPAETWLKQSSGSVASLRGLHAVDARVAWASGSEGTVVRTVDGGTSWKRLVVPESDGLDFRDVSAFDADRAVVLSVGTGDSSRIFTTNDGGATWSRARIDHDPRGFLDAIAFWDPEHGIAIGDPIDGKFEILVTDNGGGSWHRPTGLEMPDSLPGEGAFASSGTCVIVQGNRHAWFGTGGAKVARIFHSGDRGRTWNVHETPIKSASPASGAFSLAFRDVLHGVAVGGDYQHPEQRAKLAAWTEDGGFTWRLVQDQQGLGGYRSAVTYLPGSPSPTLVAVGPTGSDVSVDDGKTWRPLDATGFHVLGFAADGSGWAAGERGSLARFRGAFARGD